jgi:hypothetical protein
MNEKRKEDAPAQNTSDELPPADAGDDVVQEVNRLVEAMARAARNAWSSDQRHQLEADLRGCLGTLVENLEEALARFSRTEQGQELHEQATRVANRVRESALAAELKDGLTKGLKTATTEVQKFSDSLEERQSDTDSAQDIPVETDNSEKERQ